MKRTLLFAALATATTLALADPPDGPTPGMARGGPPLEHLAQELGLTPEQQAQVRAIFDAQHAKMEAERAQFEGSGTHPTRDQMYARREQADAEIHAQLAAVLTPAQLARFDQLHKRQRRMGPPPAEPGRPAPQ